MADKSRVVPASGMAGSRCLNHVITHLSVCVISGFPTGDFFLRQVQVGASWPPIALDSFPVAQQLSRRRVCLSAKDLGLMLLVS